MKVKDLIRILKNENPESRVLLLSQNGNPFEGEFSGVITRAETTSQGEYDEEPEDDEDVAESDVFLVDGEMLRPGIALNFDAVLRE